MGTYHSDMEDKYPGGPPPVIQQPQPGPYGQGQPYGGQAPPYGGQPPYDGQGGVMMAPPQPPAGCPPGLQYLSTVDQLVVKQKVEILEAFTGFETNNKYKIFNSLGQVYTSKEDTDCLTRQCCGPARPFDMV